MTGTIIQVERVDSAIAVVTLNRPEALNALTTPMMRQLRDTLAALDGDATCRAVVLAGAGRAFCAGLDLKSEMPGEAAAMDGMALQELFASLPLQLRRIRQPVIAAVNGVAVGAGMALSLAADIRVASSTARFLIGAVKIGLTAGECGISYHLPRIIGAGRAFEIMLTGREVLAPEAQAAGLVSQVVEPDALRDAALAMARAVIANSPFASKHTKQVMWQNLDAPSLEAAVQLENHAQVVALMTRDFAEAKQAFAEKRPPKFSGS
jgi:enoyl-CoA hydratase